MFERFTERARQVVVLAQDEARALKHNYIGGEHLLLGLLREEEGLAASVLGAAGITLEGVRAQVARVVGQGDEAMTGQIPLTPRAKKIIESALREALAFGHNYIGTEHLLLSLVRETDGVAAEILRYYPNADPERLRRITADAFRPTRPEPELVESDYDSAAQAWWAAEVVKLMLRVRDQVGALGEEYLRRAREEGAEQPVKTERRETIATVIDWDRLRPAERTELAGLLRKASAPE